ncbi:phosphate signaling complex protein PhoU [candidate division KSB1 bacterium]|nr:phosphate signaling complex protein PhoU [candidate division KSB1 bacterium]
MNIEPHYEKSLAKDLEEIKLKVLRMAELDVAALRGAMDALLRKNRQQAYIVILRDQLIDDLEDEIDRLCLQFIIRHQPVATHLRFVYSVLKMVSSLERVGDYAESMARQSVLLHDIKTNIDCTSYQELADTSIPMFQQSVQAFLNCDIEQAAGLQEIEDVADRLRFQISDQIFKQSSQGILPQDAINPLLTIARRLERVSDQAKNICQETQYVVTGENVHHRGAGGFHILFIDEDNSLLSQMAEAIGKSLADCRFHFSSAGMAVGSIHPMTVAFMAEKGIDISAQIPKTIDEVKTIPPVQLVILLSKRIRITQLKMPLNKRVLEWPEKMPRIDSGDPAILFPAFEQVYQQLSENIRDLVSALSGQDI